MTAGDAVAAAGLEPSAATQHKLVGRLERGLAHAVGALAAVAVLAEVAILLLGVFTRFVLNRPLVWTDELASMVLECLRNSYMNGSVVRVDGGIRMPPK